MKKSFMLGYHSHSTKTYNTEIEKEEQAFLESLFFGQILCPNKNITKATDSKHYQDIVKKVDCLFVSEINGFLGKGSFGECLAALKNNVPVFVIKKEDDKMILEKVTDLIQTSEYNLFQYGIVVSRKYSLRSLNKYLQQIRYAKC
jgi:hypothetical protein